MENPHSNLYTCIKDHGANIITTLRIFGVSLIFWFTPFQSSLMQLFVIVIYILIATTDAWDGWFARKYGRVTETGKILDPIADKILILTLLPLLEMQVITSFPVFVILAREFAISALRIRAAQLGQQIEAKKLGKIKTAFTMPLLGILLGMVHAPDSQGIPFVLWPLYLLMKWVQSWPKIIILTYIWLVVIITLISFFDYFREYIIGYLKLQKFPKRDISWYKAAIPNTFTVLNFSMGILASYLAFETHYGLAVLCIILGIFADAVDGPLARKLKISSKFGARLDSKADLISFGIAPTVLIFRYFSDPDAFMTNLSVEITGTIGFFLALLYAFSVWYRLNRFDKQQGHTEFFAGLPSPVGAALVLVSAISPYLNTLKVFPWIVLFSSLLMVSRVPYAHLGVAKKRKFFLLLAVCTILASLLTFAKLLEVRILEEIYAFEMLFGVIMLYVISPLFIRTNR
ncbi:MAG: CDP-alcohol phosphatidyltransferase family protein [Candidatus Wallbacteria bacterium]|nr:CDP-alcohol phosphatidyltransferase family protein [Candidatus Wallbacteria bacterium]